MLIPNAYQCAPDALLQIKKAEHSNTRPWHVCKQSDKHERMEKQIPVKELNFWKRQQMGKTNHPPPPPPPHKKKQVRENERGIANFRVNVRCVAIAIERQVWWRYGTFKSSWKWRQYNNLRLPRRRKTWWWAKCFWKTSPGLGHSALCLEAPPVVWRRNVGGGSKTPLMRRPRFRREKREGVGLPSTSAATWVTPLEANERHLATLPT
jgi:hypothetical protein